MINKSGGKSHKVNCSGGHFCGNLHLSVNDRHLLEQIKTYFEGIYTLKCPRFHNDNLESKPDVGITLTANLGGRQFEAIISFKESVVVDTSFTNANSTHEGGISYDWADVEKEGFVFTVGKTTHRIKRIIPALERLSVYDYGLDGFRESTSCSLHKSIEIDFRSAVRKIQLYLGPVNGVISGIDAFVEDVSKSYHYFGKVPIEFQGKFGFFNSCADETLLVVYNFESFIFVGFPKSLEVPVEFIDILLD